jgi:hypothetical protein
MPAFIFDPIMSPPLPRIVLSILLGKRRDFQKDARALASHLEHPLVLLGPPPQLPPGGVVILANHYMGPDFKAWWLALAISANLNVPAAWVITREWGYPDLVRRTTVTPLTRVFLQRVAHSYGFFTMPSMPPKPSDVEARAASVRRILRHVASAQSPILAMAPEGADSPDLGLAPPPAGFGRFLEQVARHGMHFLPAAVYETDAGALHVRFGPPFDIRRPSAADGGCHAAELAMRAIAQLLPAELRGAYA